MKKQTHRIIAAIFVAIFVLTSCLGGYGPVQASADTVETQKTQQSSTVAPQEQQSGQQSEQPLENSSKTAEESGNTPGQEPSPTDTPGQEPSPTDTSEQQLSPTDTSKETGTKDKNTQPSEKSDPTPSVSPDPDQNSSSENDQTKQTVTSFSAYLQEENKDKKAELTEEGTSELAVGWTSRMNLHVDAEFGDGTDKTIEISIPNGMTFNCDNDGNQRYVTSNLDGFLKEKIVSTDQPESEKASQTVFSEQQYNGTLTLKFFSHGEENDVSRVSFDVPLYTAYQASVFGGSWESGTAWFYDEVNRPVTVTQYNSGVPVSQKSVGKLRIKNDEGKQYGTTWTASYNPEAIAGGETSGGEFFYVRPIPGGDSYARRTAYRYYSITYFVPEHVEFVGFSEKGGNYCGAKCTEEKGEQTARGDDIPAGCKALTWEFNNRIAGARDLKVAPIFQFPADYFQGGETAQISVGAVHVRYYGRNYEGDKEENFDKNSYPSLTYNIRNEYEEVFANTYQTKDILEDGRRNTDFVESDYTHDLGAPGFEHTQERTGGYFIIGNRGLKDSVPKTITFTFDVKETHAVGVTQMEIPVSKKGKYNVSEVQYRTWNEKDDSTSDWKDYTGTDGTINLKDIGVTGNSGTYIKAIRLNIDTIPKEAYLKSEGRDDGYFGNIAYYFLVQVLTDNAITCKNNGQIENKMVIANQNEDSHTSTDTSGKSVYGYAYEGTSGKKLVFGNSIYYRSPISLRVSQGTTQIVTYVHHYAQANAQLIDKIYLISPFGEEFSNIRMHYEENWDKASILQKKYQKSKDSPQPVIQKVDNKDIPDQLREKYPKAVYYVLDFRSITDDQGKYDARQIGASVISPKSLENTKFSTWNSGNQGLGQGVWLTYDFSPNVSDPVGTYDDISWVEFNTGDDISKIKYNDDTWWNVRGGVDIYHLSDDPEHKHLGRMNGFALKSTEGLEVNSSAKQTDETDDWWREYNGQSSDGNKTVLRMYRDVDYKLNIRNFSSLPVSGMTAYFPVPKKGDKWGDILCQSGQFNFDMSLKSGGIQIPSGYKVSYCNATPSSKYEDWSSYQWTDQADTENWSQTDWNAVNFVKVEWVGTDNHKTIDNSDSADLIFHLTVDTAKTSADEMYKINTWRPYFSRTYQAGSSWIAGGPVATMLVPGYLSGKVWEDANHDGIIQKGEQAVSGVHVQLYDVTDKSKEPVLRVDNQYTDQNGEYRFEGLSDGTAASGWTDNCMIVVSKPDKDSKYTGFSSIPQNFHFNSEVRYMRMTSSADGKSASVEATPAKDDNNTSADGKSASVEAITAEDDNNTAAVYYDCGLVTGDSPSDSTDSPVTPVITVTPTPEAQVVPDKPDTPQSTVEPDKPFSPDTGEPSKITRPEAGNKPAKLEIVDKPTKAPAEESVSSANSQAVVRKGRTRAVKTGESNGFALYMAVFLISCVALAGFVTARKKKK